MLKTILSAVQYLNFRQGRRIGAWTHSLVFAPSCLAATAVTLLYLNAHAGLTTKTDWPYLHTAQAPHEVRVLNDGLVAFEQRLEMMERAKSSIDCMIYLFGTDESGRLALQTLMRKALEGVHVRIHLDWYNGAGEPTLGEELVTSIQRELKRIAGPTGLKGSFEVRYYNRGTILGSLGRVNHRNHAKVLIVDGKELLVGGRNISNDYFSLEKKGWEYIDRELWARSSSPVAKDNIALQAKAAFDAYWNDSEWTSKAKLLPDSASISERNKLMVLFEDDASFREPVRELREQIREVAHKNLPQTYNVNRITFAIDKPAHSKSDRVLTPELDRLFEQSNRYLLIENYSFPVSERRLKLLKSIAARKVPVVILTNSFKAHDSPGVSAFSQPQEAKLLKSSDNVWFWAFRGDRLKKDLRLADREITTKFSTHTKTFVMFSEKGAQVSVGSYNFDVRSEKTNNEAMLVVDHPGVVQNIVDDIQYRMEYAHPVTVGANDQLYFSDTGEYQEKYVSDFKKFIRAIGLWKLMRSLY